METHQICKGCWDERVTLLEIAAASRDEPFEAPGFVPNGEGDCCFCGDITSAAIVATVKTPEYCRGHGTDEGLELADFATAVVTAYQRDAADELGEAVAALEEYLS